MVISRVINHQQFEIINTTAITYKNVGWLHISMHNSNVMKILQSICCKTESTKGVVTYLIFILLPSDAIAETLERVYG
ncbi:hypothetical protein Hanom_Chr10g00909821 [Helianthus anomalus]